MIWCLLCFGFQSLKNDESTKQDGCSGTPHVWHFTTTTKDYVLLLRLPELATCRWMRMHEVVRTGEDTVCGSMCWMCRYHNMWWRGLPRLIFSLAIFAGVNGENSGRARSDWPACHFGAQWKNKTEKHDFNESVCSREEKSLMHRHYQHHNTILPWNSEEREAPGV